MKKENPNQQQIPWDKINCTYWWHFVTNPNHPKWWGNIKEGNGYSKKQGQNEAKDKNQLLISKIVMLCKNDYIQSCTEVQIYKRPKIKLLHLTNDTLLITYRNGGRVTEYTTECCIGFPKDTIHHLSVIAEMLKEGKSDQFKYYLPMKQENTTPLNERKPNFLTSAHLYKWAEYQVKNGKDFKTTYEFVEEYMKSKFPNDNSA